MEANGEINEQYLGEVLAKCGYFQRTYTSEAKTIFENLGYKRGLAVALYMIGENNQYNVNSGKYLTTSHILFHLLYN